MIVIQSQCLLVESLEPGPGREVARKIRVPDFLHYLVVVVWQSDRPSSPLSLSVILLEANDEREYGRRLGISHNNRSFPYGVY